ncbi:MAG: SDR family NAD(P)-dependent oxidoreductase [Nocardioides sp.]|jgi:NAD(P)-dependent dehydrogenase (short-subunit alcohol dehydrogenase family)
MNLQGASALVTGGGGGFGGETTRHLVKAGAKVVVADVSDDKGAAMVEELGSDNVVYVKTDVRKEEDVRAAIAAAQEMAPLRVTLTPHGGPVLAGRLVGKDGSALALDGFRKTLDFYLIGTYNVMRLAAEQTAKNESVGESGRGVIITTASIAAFEGQVGQVPYAAAKGGVVGMTIAAARDLAVAGIRVNCIAPGTFYTPAFGDFMTEEQAAERFAQGVQFPKRMGRAVEYAKLALSIIDNDYLNGETIRIDGALRFGPKG